MLSYRSFGLTDFWLTFWVTVACGTDMTLFGYDQGVFGGVIVTEDFLDTIGIRGNANNIAIVTSIYNIGCFLGAIAAMWLGDKLGRKKTILIGTTIMTVGAVLQIAASSFSVLMVGRIIAGVGNGMNTSTAPVWQSETSKASMRGKLVVIEMILNVAGFSLSNWITYGFSKVQGGLSWRFPLAFQLVFIFVLYATVPWLPESPRWLIANSNIDEARQIIADLEGFDINDQAVEKETKAILAALKHEEENAVSWMDLLRGRTGNQKGTSTIRRLLLGVGTQVMQQLSGINVTSYYLPTVLIESVKLSTDTARLVAGINSVSYLCFSCFAIYFIEKLGRRNLMIYAAAGQAFCYVFITVLIRYSQLPGYAHQEQVGAASVAFFFIYYIFFGIGWQGVPWLYPTEINSSAMRTKGAALGTAANWICNFMVVEITPIGIQALQWKFYIIWMVFNASFVPIIYLFYPETSDRKLEDMDRYFGENHDIFVFKYKDAISVKRPYAYGETELHGGRSGRLSDDSEETGSSLDRKKSGSIKPIFAHSEERNGSSSR